MFIKHDTRVLSFLFLLVVSGFTNGGDDICEWSICTCIESADRSLLNIDCNGEKKETAVLQAKALPFTVPSNRVNIRLSGIYLNVTDDDKIFMDVTSANWMTVDKLELINTEFIHVPPRFFHSLTDVKTIDIQDCEMTEHEFEKLFSSTDTTYLRLYANKIKKITKNMFRAMNAGLLQKLEILDSNIQFIHEEAFMHLSKLATLRLDNTQIGTMMDDTHGVVDLKFLNQNHFLSFLSLEMNQFQEFPILPMVPQLEEIILSYNLFTKIPKNAIFQHSKVFLFQANNCEKLERIEDCAFCGPKPGKFEIFVHNCPKLSYIAPTAFDDVKMKTTLINLARNNLSVIPGQLIDWASDQRANFTGNPLDCSGCNNAWMSSVEAQITGSCATPGSEKGKALSKRVPPESCPNVPPRPKSTGRSPTTNLSPSPSPSPLPNGHHAVSASLTVVLILLVVAIILLAVAYRWRYTVRYYVITIKRRYAGANYMNDGVVYDIDRFQSVKDSVALVHRDEFVIDDEYGEE